MDGRQQLMRYEELCIGESLSNSYRYPVVCRELSCILRRAYTKLPKSLQSLIVQHTLLAFTLLPQMQTQSAVSAANFLVQSAEAVLPKQKKVLAVKEFKHAMVSYKRRSKDRREEGSLQLPQDILLHIFSFIDLRSLLCAASVCRSWNLAASDDHLWQLLYIICFRDSNNSSEGGKDQINGTLDDSQSMKLQGDTNNGSNINWRKTFEEKYRGSSSRKFLFDRGYCEHCDAVVWLSNMNCPNKCCRIKLKNRQLKPISPEQLPVPLVQVAFNYASKHVVRVTVYVFSIPNLEALRKLCLQITNKIVEYILNGTRSTLSSSESDTDSDDESLSKLWLPFRFLGD